MRVGLVKASPGSREGSPEGRKAQESYARDFNLNRWVTVADLGME